MDTDSYIQMYIETLTQDELTCLEIAKAQLETSFDISKSIGFLKFLKQHSDHTSNVLTDKK